MRTPAWDEVREFLRHDRWTPDKQRSSDHDYFEKTLPDGEILITKVSRSSNKTMSAGRFKAILADQLRINEAQFWNVLRAKEPAARPPEAPEAGPPSLPVWLVRELERGGVTAAEIEALDEPSALAVAMEIPSRPGE